MFFRSSRKTQEQAPKTPGPSEVDPKIRDRFKGKPINLLNKDQLEGLAIVLSVDSSRFKHDENTSFEQIEENGKLKYVRMYCTDNPSWLIRALGRLKLEYGDIEQRGKLYYIDINPKSLQYLKWGEIINKFNNNSTDKLESSHFETLAKIHDILIANNSFLQPHSYEQRLAGFIPGKKTDGPLDTIMVKFELDPQSQRLTPNTMDDFNIYIDRLKDRLGVDNFNRLVKGYGAAATGYDEKTNTVKVVYIEFKADELAKGLELEQSAPRPH